MSETTPDPADVHTGTDRVELTDAERERIIEAIYQGRVRACRETVENWGPPEDEADTHSLLLRVLRGESEGFVANALPVVASIVAARVQALTAERDAARGEHGGGWFWSQAEWSDWSNRLASFLPEEYDGDEAQEAIIERALTDLVAENAALQATLDRVTALADGWAHDGPDDSVQIFITRLRAALTPEGKP